MRISDWSSDVCSSDLGHIIISAAGFDHRLLADHALALHLVEDAVAVADQPMAREKLDLPLPFVFDPHMIGPEPAPVGRLALIGKVAHDDANRHAARGGGMREQRLQSPTALKARSEEHTSELQSLMRNSYAVFCLKKKKQSVTKPNITT